MDYRPDSARRPAARRYGGHAGGVRALAARVPTVLVLAAGLVCAHAEPALASWMLPQAPYRAKDFAITKRDGLYHVFYIRNNTTLPQSQTELDLGHATSPNLWDWTQWPAVLPIRAGEWDNEHVWAPSVVEKDGLFWMFYTGTTRDPGIYNSFQRIGVATSSDLFTWNRLDAPVFSCDQVPWSYCNPLDAKTAFRDPFVMPDPAQPGGWLMYYSGSDQYDSSMVVGVARSEGDLTQWYDLMPLWNTYWSYTGGFIAESPHVFEFKGLWYLFFTTVASQPLTFETSPNPIGAPWEWTWRGRLGDVLGLNTAAWYASEQIQDGVLDFFCFVEADRIAFYRMGSLAGDWRFYLIQPDRFRVMRMSWNADTARVNQPLTLDFRAVGWSGKSAEIEAVELLGGGTERVVPNDSLGLPLSIPMTADSTLYGWAARTLPATADPAGTLHLVVRLKDRTAATAVLHVLADSVPPVDPEPPPGAQPPQTAYDDGSGDEPLMRPLRYSPYGGQAVLVELPREAQARVDVFDLQGRRVRNLADRVLPRGASVLTWDGRTAEGMRAGAGVYFVRVVTPTSSATARMVVTP